MELRQRKGPAITPLQQLKLHPRRREQRHQGLLRAAFGHHRGQLVAGVTLGGGGALLGTVSISGMILFIIVGATTFSQILSFSGASNGLVQWITGQALAPWVVVAAMMALLIFLGVFVDQVSMMMITLPIFMPVVTSLNIDLVWFGVMFLICMQLGMLLPPHGMLLMTMKGVAPPEVTMGHIFKAVTPYVIMSILLLVLVFCVPTVAVWLPNLMD